MKSVSPITHLVQPLAIEFLEQDIDRMNESLPMLKEFILPAGTLACSYAHQARAVCRRAERSLMTVHNRDQNIQTPSLQLLNRLSDWLFVASRSLQRAEGGSEVLWQKNINDSIGNQHHNLKSENKNKALILHLKNHVGCCLNFHTIRPK